MEERVGEKENMTTGNEVSVTQSYTDVVRAKKVMLQGREKALAREPIK